MKKTIVALLMILAFTVAGIGMVTPAETNADCLICCAACGVVYMVCMDACQGDQRTCENACGMLRGECEKDCWCCSGCSCYSGCP